jgi:hypothetical protein
VSQVAAPQESLPGVQGKPPSGPPGQPIIEVVLVLEAATLVLLWPTDAVLAPVAIVECAPLLASEAWVELSTPTLLLVVWPLDRAVLPPPPLLAPPLVVPPVLELLEQWTRRAPARNATGETTAKWERFMGGLRARP